MPQICTQCAVLAAFVVTAFLISQATPVMVNTFSDGYVPINEIKPSGTDEVYLNHSALFDMYQSIIAPSRQAMGIPELEPSEKRTWTQAVPITKEINKTNLGYKKHYDVNSSQSLLMISLDKIQSTRELKTNSCRVRSVSEDARHSKLSRF